MNKEELKDRRIAFLAIRRDLLLKGLDIEESKKQAYRDIEELYLKYPFEQVPVSNWKDSVKESKTININDEADTPF